MAQCNDLQMKKRNGRAQKSSVDQPKLNIKSLQDSSNSVDSAKKHAAR